MSDTTNPSRDIGTNRHRGIQVKFTDILYAAVIAETISRASLSHIGVQSGMLMLALMIVFDDWFLYHINVQYLANTMSTYAMCYVLDIIILSVWYAFVRIAVLSDIKISLFIIMLVLFYTLTSLWELLLSGHRSLLWRFLLKDADIPLLMFYGAMCVINMAHPLKPGIAVPICIGGFLVTRIFIWIPLFRDTSELR